MRRDPGEHRSAAGEVLMSHNHICLLHGLYDRPSGQVCSRAELMKATMPYLRQLNSGASLHCLAKAVPGLRPGWVGRRRIGRMHVWTLTARGRRIIERKVAARIRGYGPYEGFRALVRAARADRVS